MRQFLSVAITLALTAASCSSSATPETSETESTAVQDDSATTVGPESIDEGVYRVAEPGQSLGDLLAWDTNEIRKQGHGDSLLPMPAGPFFTVVDVPHLGVVYQRSELDQVIWLMGSEGERDLLVTDGEKRIELEGAGVNDADQGLIFYQRHDPGSPEDTLSTLRSYNVETAEVTVLGTTGGWESGTNFSHLTGGATIGRWGAEGWTGLSVYDLGASDGWGEAIGVECFDGEDGCIWYDQAVIFSGEGYGIGPAPASADGIVDAFALYRFDLASGEREVVLSMPWDNSLWYAEDMFALGGKLVVSLKDDAGDPLPALVYDVASGSAWTLPQSGFVRPSYLS